MLIILQYVIDKFVSVSRNGDLYYTYYTGYNQINYIFVKRICAENEKPNIF